MSRERVQYGLKERETKLGKPVVLVGMGASAAWGVVGLIVLSVKPGVRFFVLSAGLLHFENFRATC